MALAKEIVPISFVGGVSTKDDPKQVGPTKLLSLTNGVFASPGQIKKRNGYTTLTSSTLTGGTVSSGALLSNFQNESVLCDGQSLYTDSPDMSAWVSKGTLVNCQASVSTISRSGNSQDSPDCAYHAGSGLKCFVYRDGGVPSYSVVDTATGATIVNDLILGSGLYIQCKVLTSGSNFVVVLLYLGALSYVTIPVSAPQTQSGPTTLVSDCSGNYFDATVINGAVCVAYKNAVNTISACAIGGAEQIYSAGGHTPTGAFSIVGDASNNAWIAWVATGSVYAMVLSSGLTSQALAPTLVQSSGSAYPCVNLTGAVTGTTATYFMEGQPPSTGVIASGFAVGNAITSKTLTISGTVASGPTPAGGLLCLGLASKAFAYGGNYYFAAIYAGAWVPTAIGTLTLATQEPTLFLLNKAGVAVAKYSAPDGGTYLGTGLLPEVCSPATGNYFWGTQEVASVTTSAGAPVISYGISQASVNFAPSSAPSSIQIGNSVLIASGIVAQYDGKVVCEQNFLTYPENLTASYTLSGGGIGPGIITGHAQWQYQACWEWVDGQGQMHRSAPSPAVTVSLPSNTLTFSGTTATGSNIVTYLSSGAGLFVGQTIVSAGNFISGTTITALTTSSPTFGSAPAIVLSNPCISTGAAGVSFSTPDVHSINVYIPPLSLTQRPAGTVQVVLYRTQCDGTVFYKVGSSTAQTTNSAVISDSMPDAEIIGNAQLYTTGEVDNGAPPTLSCMTTFKSRAIGIPTENPNGFVYSKQVIPAPAGIGGQSSPVEFSPYFIQACDSLGGQLYALGQLDDKLILFKQSTLFYMSGAGPAASGTNNDFTDPMQVVSPVGCVNPASVAQTPFGLMFQANTGGIWLLDRSLGVTYIGAEVEALTAGQTVASAARVPAQNQVRFVLSNGTAVVYDYYAKQWSDFSNHPAVSTATYSGNFAYLTSGGTVFVEAPGTFTDNGSFIQLSLTTAWIQIAKLQGFQRVWRALILGTWKSAHTLGVGVYVDFLGTAAQTVSIPVPTAPSSAYQFRIHMAQQKCEAIQFQIQDTQSGSYGEGFAISGLSLEAGVETSGGVKLPAAQSY